MSKNEKQSKSEFQRYIAEARRAVERWPDWKRNALGIIDESYRKAQGGKHGNDRDLSTEKRRD